MVKQIRRLLDLDADLQVIEQHLHSQLGASVKTGLRIPGVWSAWEAGIRAILGQQVSIAGARAQLNRLLVLGTEQPSPSAGSGHTPDTVWRLFPTPAQVVADELLMIKVPGARRQTILALAGAMEAGPAQHPSQWLPIKGIGPWTVAYACLRGLSETDVWLGGDLGIQKALARQHAGFDAQTLSPWRSYATLQLWFGLADAPTGVAVRANLPGE